MIPMLSIFEKLPTTIDTLILLSSPNLTDLNDVMAVVLL